MSRDVLIVVDMQVGLLDGLPKHDLAGVIQRINALAAMVRQKGGQVVWIRHCGKAGDGFERGSKGWAFLPELDRAAWGCRRREDAERFVCRHRAARHAAAPGAGPRPDRRLGHRLLRRFHGPVGHLPRLHVVAVSDAHTLSDRPHLDAPTVIRHHNWVWSDLLTNRSTRVVTTSELIAEQR